MSWNSTQLDSADECMLEHVARQPEFLIGTIPRLWAAAVCPFLRLLGFDVWGWNGTVTQWEPIAA